MYQSKIKAIKAIYKMHQQICQYLCMVYHVTAHMK